MLNKINSLPKDEIIKSYLNNRSSLYLAKDYSVSFGTILNLLRQNGVKIRKTNKKYSYDHTYFDNINSEDRAYFMGLIYADGNNNGTALYIKLQDRDVHILETMKKYMKSNHKLYLRKYSDKNPKWRDQYLLRIFDPRLSVSMEKIGIPKNKTFKLKFPTWLNDELTRHFIRGFFDGDGSLSFSLVRGYKKAIWRIFGLKNICEHLAKIIKKQVGINTHVYKVEKTYAVTVSGNIQILKLMNWLYENSNPELRLIRKYEKYISLIGGDE
jgi:intein-encoded DNA endonuclease-like protein